MYLADRTVFSDSKALVICGKGYKLNKLPYALGLLGFQPVCAEPVMPDVLTAISDNPCRAAVICAPETEPLHTDLMLGMLFERGCRCAVLVTLPEKDSEFLPFKEKYLDLTTVMFPFSETELALRIRELTDLRGRNVSYSPPLEKSLRDYLMFLGLNSRKAGFECVLSGVKLILSQGASELPYQAVVLPYIAEQCGCTTAAADQNIRSQRGQLLESLGEQRAKQMFPSTAESGKLTNIGFLSGIASAVLAGEPELVRRAFAK